MSKEERLALAAFLAGPRDFVAGIVAKPVKQTWGSTTDGKDRAKNRYLRNAAMATRDELNTALQKLDALIKSLSGTGTSNKDTGKQKKKGK
jgi:hypothetical protein